MLQERHGHLRRRLPLYWLRRLLCAREGTRDAQGPLIAVCLDGSGVPCSPRMCRVRLHRPVPPGRTCVPLRISLDLPRSVEVPARRYCAPASTTVASMQCLAVVTNQAVWMTQVHLVRQDTSPSRAAVKATLSMTTQPAATSAVSVLAASLAIPSARRRWCSDAAAGLCNT